MSRRRMPSFGFRPDWLHTLFTISSLVASLVLLVQPTAAQTQNPYSANPKAAKAGEFEFRINCALCHGLGARGGGRGPDLTRAHKRHGDSDGDMFRNISQGIPGTVMPANGTNGQGVGMTDEEIWQIITYLRSVQVRAPAKNLGNPANGKKLFYGDANCSMCHMVNGKGGRTGPDLTSIGISRTVESLMESVRNPSRRLAWGLTEPTKEFAQRYETVTVVTPDGKEIKGIALNEDSFSLQMMDTAEHILLFDKDKLRSINKDGKSLMPVYQPTMLSEQDLNDIIAYLLDVAKK
jgi:cytochrome c oxidase cbb3-type subunit III